MKNSVRFFPLLCVIVFLISYAIISYFGKSYTLNFELNHKNNCDLIIENDTGEIDIVEEKEKDGQYLVKIRGIKPGKVYLYFDYGGFQTGKIIYVHKSLIITEDNYLGKSTGAIIIPISLSIILLYILFLLIKRYKHSLNENIYQYKNIAYLGLMIYITFLAIYNVLSIFNYQGLFETINRMIDSLSFVSTFLLPICFITFILVTISNINLIRKEGKSLRNLLGLFLGIFICLLTILPDHVYHLMMQSQKINIYNLNSLGPYLYNFMEAMVYLTVTYLECFLIATIILSIRSIHKKMKLNKDYMIILGCQIKKDGSLTPLLKGRVDRALQFRNEQLKATGKDLIFVPSGGRGNDEVISEAEAIEKYLLDQGINKNHILVENRAKNTYENIKFSNELINNKSANIGFSTTNYHVMRAGLIATAQGLKLEGIGSKTKSYFWINAFIREFIGTLYSEKKKYIIFFLLNALAIIIMIGITYIGNNV